MAEKLSSLEVCSHRRSYRMCLVIAYDFSLLFPQGAKIDKMIPQVPLVFPTKDQVYIQARQNGGDVSSPAIPSCSPSPTSCRSHWLEWCPDFLEESQSLGSQACWPFFPQPGWGPEPVPVCAQTMNTVPTNLLSNLMGVLPMFQNYKLGPKQHKNGMRLGNRNVF